MASSLGFVSRRKQSKPQRHQDLHRGSALAMDIEDLSDSVDSSPIDLSTKGIERGIFEDKSRLFLASLSSPQHLLSLCAQLAANRDTSKETIVSAPEARAPQIESQTEEERNICCVASGCEQVFSSRGRLLWHIVEDHSEQNLLLCDQCGRRFGDRDQIREHDCLLTDRPSSAGADRITATSPDADRGSVPTSSGPSFSLVERARTPVPTVNLFNEMFPSKPHVDLPMGPLFPLPMPQFAHGPHHPPPFFVRPPFEHRPDMFAPRQENGEDDWEALMEISTTDEGEKIRALVGDKAMPTTDPNQCILCRRVLSCKSALQMHYRTHTGERPFKCKICQRAFTTKGNLKTHMGVHRAKHSFRGVPIGIGGHIGGPVGNPMGTIGLPNSFSPGLQPTQQCPICQKRFITAMQLQSHISEHTQALTGRVMPSMTSHPSPIKMMQTGNGRFPSGFPIFPFFAPSVSHGEVSASFNLAQLLGNQLNNVHPPMGERPFEEAESPKEEREDRPNVSTLVKLDVLKSDAPGTSSISPSVSSEGSASSQEQTNDHTDGSSVGRSGESDTEEKRGLRQVDSTLIAADERPRALSTPSLTAENPLEAMQKMWAETEPPPPRQLPVLSKHQCAVCFKHFSSSSALQIHMRTHTGDKPFKCEMCGRAFTTRGNLKVHMGTHMWQQSPSRRGRRIFDAVVSDASSLKPPTGGIGTVGGIPLLPPLGLFPPTGVPNMEMMMMLWRTVCSVCQKVCASPSELEQHLKDHLSGSLSRDASSPQSIHTD